MNEHYKKAAASVKTMNKSGTSMFGALLRFAHDFRTNGAESLKEQFKAHEKLATAEMKVEMTKNSTYKVAKGKLVKAVELGIELVDAEGKAIGKTDLESKIKDAEGAPAPAKPAAEATDFDKFSQALALASELSDKVKTDDTPIAAGLVSTLYKKLADRMPVAAAA